MREKGKGFVESCIICGEKRHSDQAHFPRRKRKGDGGKETIPLCPTHHKLLENGRLSKLEFEKMWHTRYGDRFNSVEEFVEWAHENGYPYSMEDLENKFWDYAP